MNNAGAGVCVQSFEQQELRWQAEESRIKQQLKRIREQRRALADKRRLASDLRHYAPLVRHSLFTVYWLLPLDISIQNAQFFSKKLNPAFLVTFHCFLFSLGVYCVFFRTSIATARCCRKYCTGND